MQWKKLFYFLLINIFVSVLTTLAVLSIWDRSHRTNQVENASEIADVVFPTVTPSESSQSNSVPLQFYLVGPQDTLDEIALAFDISLEELMALNAIENKDLIGVGDQIIVPASKLGDTQIGIVIVTTPGDLVSERVKIQNYGNSAVSLSGWVLEDEDGNQFQFPQITLFNNGAIEIYSSVGINQSNRLYWGLSEAIWEPGETITLRDIAENIQAQGTVNE